MKIIFFGTPEFGAIILDGLVSAGLSPALVITEPDKPVGRKQIVTPLPVKVLAKKYNIPVMQSERVADCKSEVENLKPDLGIVAAYGQMLPQNLLDIPKFGFLNVHPSLLPKYRGPSPIQSAILSGEEETGVTIMLVSKKMDAGPILANGKKQLTSNIIYRELHDELANLGAELLVKTVPDWVEGKIKPQEQNEAEATYTNIIKKEDGYIDWEKDASYIERQVRALNPWPGTFTKFEIKGLLKTIKVLKSNVLKQTGDGPFGDPGKTFLGTNDKIAVQTGKDFLIIEELQVEGKKPLATIDFLRGHQDFIGTIFQ
ncbi:MAG: methionyl-tRNA formyltransferase [bacterium]|nr:methionyl-tRNA formyltransferase [bacterium]